MSFKEVTAGALALSRTERETLVTTLLETLPSPGADISDEAVLHREIEMDSGTIQPIMHEEFVRRVNKERGR